MSLSTEKKPIPKVLEIRRTAKYGFSVQAADSGAALLFIACHESPNTSDIIIHEEANADPNVHGPYVAQAWLSPHDKDLRIFVGEGKDVHDWDWDVVRHSKEKKGLFRSSIDSYRFKCTEPAAAPEAKPSKRRLAWTESSKGFELIDEATEAVLAAYVDKSTLGEVGLDKTLGRLECDGPCSKQMVLAALVSIMGVLEKKRRTMRQVSRAVAWQAAPGRGPAGNSG